MPNVAHISAMSEIVVEKEIARAKPAGTPRLYFPKEIFDALWGKDDRIPVKIVFERNRITIERKSAEKTVFIDADADCEVISQ